MLITFYYPNIFKIELEKKLRKKISIESFRKGNEDAISKKKKKEKIWKKI
jgi:hypothetical protein